MDTLTKKERSIRMSKIRSSNTKPEILVRQSLFKKGFRYRINNKALPGKPDITILKYKLIIDVRGCFWHGHENCRDGHVPKTNSAFWKNKFIQNKARDIKNHKKLKEMGFNVFILWECEINKKNILDKKIKEIENYLLSFKK